MRLDELLGIKRFRNKTPIEAAKILRGELGGLRYIGSGSHGLTMTDGHKVFKFWMVDSAYEAFIELAIKHQDNPYFPKVLSPIKTLKVFPGQEINGIKLEDVRYIKLELLTAYKSKYYYFDKARIIKSDITHIIKSFCIPPYNLSDLEELICTVYKNQIDVDSFELSDELTELFEVVQLIKPLINDGHVWDIGYNNVMMRDDQLVFTDPIYNVNDNGFSAKFLKLGELD